MIKVNSTVKAPTVTPNGNSLGQHISFVSLCVCNAMLKQSYHGICNCILFWIWINSPKTPISVHAAARMRMVQKTTWPWGQTKVRRYVECVRAIVT
jgi:hypothetical protein